MTWILTTSNKDDMHIRLISVDKVFLYVRHQLTEKNCLNTLNGSICILLLF